MLKVIGMMSGTSLDGVDAALIETDGEQIAAFGPTAFVPYSNAEQAILRAAFGLWPDGDSARLQAASRVLLDRHTEAIARLPKADLIGFHGQTLIHDPAAGRTHQLGDGAALARRTGVRVVWDFRSEDMRQGGQGAPLVPFFHHALARRLGKTRPLAFLNIGGVANVTWIDPAVAEPQAEGALLAFDTGPGNALMNDFAASRMDQPFDRDGALARSGHSDPAWVRKWLDHPFFAAPPPKSLDRNAFAAVVADVAEKSVADGMRCLLELSVAAIAGARDHFPNPVSEYLVAGGGARNGFLMERLWAELGVSVRRVADCELDGDMLEAQAFAWLAARSLRRLPLSSPATTGCREPCSGGRISS